jgi:hypothetical protein
MSTAVTTRPTRTETKPLMLAGLAAGPIYVVTSLVQAFTREGFDPTRHAWSMLAAGSLGWIQRSNLFITGLLVLAFAIGLRPPLRGGRGATAVPRLIGLFGVGMMLASFFSADPALGFPPGTPADSQQMSWHGVLHMVTASTGFIGLIIACIIMARRFADDGRRAWSVWSAATGVLFIAATAGLSATGKPFWILTFTGAVVLVFTWLAALAIRVRSGRSI